MRHVRRILCRESDCIQKVFCRFINSKCAVRGRMELIKVVKSEQCTEEEKYTGILIDHFLPDPTKENDATTISSGSRRKGRGKY